MKKAFVSNNKTEYMARDGDIAYHTSDGFLLKVKLLKDKHKLYKVEDKFNLMIVASRKVGNAVTRNLLKRRLRVLFSELEVSSLCSAEYVYVIIIRKELSHVEFDNLKLALVQGLQRMNRRIEKKFAISDTPCLAS